MTPEQIRAAIAADPALQALAASRADDGAIAAALSTGTEYRSRMISERGILDGYAGGPIAADAVLAKLEACVAAGQPLSSLVGRALKFLAQSDGLDVGAASTRAMLDQLAAGGVITTTEAGNLKALASYPVTVSVQDVAKALEGQ